MNTGNISHIHVMCATFTSYRYLIPTTVIWRDGHKYTGCSVYYAQQLLANRVTSISHGRGRDGSWGGRIIRWSLHDHHRFDKTPRRDLRPIYTPWPFKLFNVQPVCNPPPFSWTSYRAYVGRDNMRMSGRNFSTRISMTSRVVAVLETRMHLVDTLDEASWKKYLITPWNSRSCGKEIARDIVNEISNTLYWIWQIYFNSFISFTC